MVMNINQLSGVSAAAPVLAALESAMRRKVRDLAKERQED